MTTTEYLTALEKRCDELKRLIKEVEGTCHQDWAETYGKELALQTNLLTAIRALEDINSASPSFRKVGIVEGYVSWKIQEALTAITQTQP